MDVLHNSNVHGLFLMFYIIHHWPSVKNCFLEPACSGITLVMAMEKEGGMEQEVLSSKFLGQNKFNL